MIFSEMNYLQLLLFAFFVVVVFVFLVKSAAIRMKIRKFTVESSGYVVVFLFCRSKVFYFLHTALKMTPFFEG